MSQVVDSLPEDQISPKTVVEKAIGVYKLILKSWKILIFFPLIGYLIGWGLDWYLKKPDRYEAFMLFNLGGSSAPAGGNFGDISSLLGMGGGGDANIFTGENFLIFVKSRPVTERALMKKIKIEKLGNKEVLLANFYIDSSGIKTDNWEDSPEKHTFKFPNADPKTYNLKQRLVLNELIEHAQVNSYVYQPNRLSSFIMLQVNTESPMLSKIWAENLLETVEEVYTETQTLKSRKTLRLFQKRADSLAVILGRTENRLAREMDYGPNITVAENKMQVNKLSRNSNFIQQLYFEALANVENIKASLVREAPLFTIIDPVKDPVDKKVELAKRAQLGLLIGVVLAFVTIYAINVYKSIMAEPKK